LRYIVFGIILFLPLLVYVAWALVVRRKKELSGGTWDDAPFTRLVILGLLLMAAALVVSRFLHTGQKPTSIVPPQYDDDRFIRKPEPPVDGEPR
jgi:hypothetical protein